MDALIALHCFLRLMALATAIHALASLANYLWARHTGGPLTDMLAGETIFFTVLLLISLLALLFTGGTLW